MTITHLSPSAISSLNNCGHSFKLSYDLKLPRGPEDEAQRIGFAVHNALERFYNSVDRTRPLLEWLAAEESEEFGVQEKKVVKFATNIFNCEDPTAVQVVGTEMRLRSRKYGLVGVIDRLDKVGDVYRVVDYKTGKFPYDPTRLRQKLQQGVYYKMLVEEVLDLEVEEVAFYYLGVAGGKVASFDPTDMDIEQVFNEIWTAWSDVAVADIPGSGVYDPKPSVLCGWCPYQALCPAWGGKLPEGIE